MGAGLLGAGRGSGRVPAGTGLMLRRGAAAALMVASLALGACAAGPVRYPGRADVRAGDAALIRIEPTNATETAPHWLRVPTGTDVVWLNASQELVFVRFAQAVGEACGTPLRFVRSYDGRSYVTGYLAPFNEARLCFARPGRYDFIVSSSGGGGGGTPPDADANGGHSPVRYGTVIVE